MLKKLHISFFKVLVLGVLGFVLGFANPVQGTELIESWKKMDDLGETALKTDVNALKSARSLLDVDPDLVTKELVSAGKKLNDKDLLKFVPDLSDADAAAIHRYTVNNFEFTAGAFDNSLTTKQQEWIDLVNSGLDKLRPTKGYQGKVYRGQNRPEAEILERYVNVYNEGVARGITPRVNEPPLLSTSKNTAVAEDFIKKFKNPNKVEVLFEINSKRGVDIDDISDYGKNLCSKNSKCDRIQEEVILSNNQDFEILDVVKSTNTDGSTRYIIKLSE